VITERELVVLKRRARGETQREIAQALQITQGAVSRFEQRAHEKILDAEQVQRTAKEVGLRTEQGVSKRRVTYKERPRS
jgi:transcriptional regulator